MTATITIPAVIVGLVDIARRQEFPKSVFAMEIVSVWMMDVAHASGDTNPETSADLKAVESELGITYMGLLELGTSTKEAELNCCMEAALANRDMLLRACALVATEELCGNDYMTSDFEWRMWPHYDLDDVVTFPQGSTGCLNSVMPLEVLQLIFHHSPTPSMNLIRDFSEAVKQFFEAHVTEFCYPASESVSYP